MTEHNASNSITEATQILNDLKSRIRSYVLWEGLSLVVALLGGIFWASFTFDWLYFSLSHLELPRWFRAAVLMIGIGLVAAGAFSWIALRLFRGFQSKALALVLERRFPELDDRLITAVEVSEGQIATDSPLTTAMLQRTLVDVVRAAKQLDLRSVFNRQPLRRASILAVAIVASILGLMVVDLAAMERWVSGYLQLRNDYWPRETDLRVRVVVQPGDQLREFVDHQYRHPKGGDLALQIEVPEGKTRPDRIRLDVRMGRGSTQVWLTPSADHFYRHTFVGLIENARFWVSGGDFSHSTPFQVEVVPPPEIKQIILHSRYHDYTGLNRQTNGGVERTPNEIKGAQISLPEQTDIVMELTSNKPLRYARLEGDAGQDRWEIEVSLDAAGHNQATITLKSQDGKSQNRLALPLGTPSDFQPVSPGGPTSLTLPFILQTDAVTKLPALLRAAEESGKLLEAPLPLPADSLLRVSLEDSDQIISPAPTRFTINAIVDQPPLVETKLKGIGTSITRKARIPLVGTITDDYGIAAAEFEYRIDDATDWQTRLFSTSPQNAPREFTLRRGEKEPYERFDVQPLDLSTKQRLILTVSAIDNCTLPATEKPSSPAGEKDTDPSPRPTAHKAQSLKYVFTIIPEEELLSVLYARELNLRKRVEQIITESKTSLKELQAQQDRMPEYKGLKEANTAPDTEPLKTITLALNAAADRSLHGVRKNAVETAGVENAFAEIREELINNAADTPTMLERLDDKILAPLAQINSRNFPSLDGTLGLLKLSLDKNTDPSVPLETSIDELTTLIQRLELVLGEMAELARFDAVLEDLKKTIKAEQDLLEETKRKRKEKAIKALE